MSESESGIGFQEPTQLNPDTISKITDVDLLTKIIAKQEKGDGIQRSPQNERRLIELRTAVAVSRGEDRKAARMSLYDETLTELAKSARKFGETDDSKSLKYELMYKKNLVAADRPDVTPIEGVWIDFIDANQVQTAGIDTAAKAETIIKSLDKQNQLFGRSPARDEVKWSIFRIKQGLI